jgi:hypothetical protein
LRTVEDFEARAEREGDPDRIEALVREVCRHPWGTPTERTAAQAIAIRLELALRDAGR